MDNVKKYLKLKEDMDSLESRMSFFKNSIEGLEAELQPVEEEVIRLEILEDPLAAKKKRELQSKKEQLERLKTEREDAIKRLRIMAGLLVGFRESAFQEIQIQAKKDFAPKLKDFGRAIRAAAKAEEAMRAVWNEAERKARQGIGYGGSPIASWDPALLRKPAYPSSLREWEELLRQFENAGYDIE